MLSRQTSSEGTVSSFDGTPIHYRRGGEGKPPLVFVHGWSCDGRLWDGQLSRLARGYGVVALDLGGHGRSGRGRKDWTIPAFGGDVRAVVERLDLKEVVLIGHSMGGPVVLETARIVPQRVRAVVLVDTIHDAEFAPGSGAVDTAIEPFQADFKAAAEKFVRERLFVPASPPQVVSRVVAEISTAAPAIAVSALRHSWSYDPRPALREIRCPIRAINSDLFPTNLEANRRHAPDFEARILRGVGHYPMLEEPTRFNELLEQTFRELTTAQKGNQS